jgi:large subunit ribosomal protein L4
MQGFNRINNEIMEVSVLNINGQETGRKVVLNDAIFGIEPNDHVLYLDVKQYLANQRQGTAKAKERSEHAGSTRKLGRQKGGGGARHGDINSPLMRGGGRVFGPRPRDYRFKLNKKVKDLARRSALTYKAQENAILVVEDFNLDAPKTKDFVNITKNLKAEGKKMLFLLSDENKNVYLSARNLQRVEVMLASSLNSYKVLNADVVVITENSLPKIDEVLINK